MARSTWRVVIRDGERWYVEHGSERSARGMAEELSTHHSVLSSFHPIPLQGTSTFREFPKRRNESVISAGVGDQTVRSQISEA